MSDFDWSDEENEDQQYQDSEDYQDYAEEQDGSDEVLEELMSQDEVATLESASLRLAQAELYQMLAKHNVFEGVDAPQAAVRKVQQELKDFVLERLNILLGMTTEKQKLEPSQVQVQLPFNSMEVHILKELAFKASKGETAKYEDEAVEAQVVTKELPKKQQGLKPITVKAKKQLQSQVKRSEFSRPKYPNPPPPRRKRPAQEEESGLVKAPHEMSDAEKAEHIEATKHRYYKATHPKVKPIISGEATLAMWQNRQAQHRAANDIIGPGTASIGSAVASSLNIQPSIETVDE